MPRARKGNALRKGGQRRGGGARSSTQADSGSSEDEAASEARSTTSDCPSLLSATTEDCLGGEAVDEQSQQENLEEKLKGYVAATDVQDLVSCLACLEGVFSWSCGTSGSAASLVPASLHGLLCAALQAWALLLTICPGTHISHILDRQLPRLPQLLSSESVNLRIAAGEAIALLFELARDLEEDFVYEDMEALCGSLRTLATDSNKYRAKVDRRRQRSIFRAVLHFVEGGECEEETVRFGLEVLYIDSWARHRIYTAFKDVLGSGIHYHLQHLYNAAAFKARTKARSRARDKRADIL